MITGIHACSTTCSTLYDHIHENAFTGAPDYYLNKLCAFSSDSLKLYIFALGHRLNTSYVIMKLVK